MIESIQQFQDTNSFIIVAHDENAFNLLEDRNLQNTKIVLLQDLLLVFPELLLAKQIKSHSEFLFAVTPFLVKYAQKFSSKGDVWYIDADIYFFRSFENLENQVESWSIVVTAHNFPARLRHLEKYGIYNVGIVYLSGDSESKITLEWWANKCLEDSSVFHRDEVYGDQKYLDEFPHLNDSFTTFRNVEDNCAPWNIETSDITKIVSYHFSGLRRYSRFTYAGLSIYLKVVPAIYLHAIYDNYNKHLDRIEFSFAGRRILDSRKLSNRAKIKMIRSRDFLVDWNKVIYRTNN